MKASEYNYESLVDSFLRDNKRIPGWGSSFIKGGPDPVFFAVDCILNGSDTQERQKRVTSYLHSKELDLYPNASYYTIACCIESKTPIEKAAFHLVNARLPAWTELWVLSSNQDKLR